MDFYTGRVLRVDLTAQAATVETLDTDWARLFVGGKGLLLRYLYGSCPREPTRSPRRTRSSSPTGPFAGTTVATCSRLAVGCKSPATGTLLDSYVGGSFAPELKFAGYDVVILTGAATEPVLLLIEDDRVEFLPAAGRFWGLETVGPGAARARAAGAVPQSALHRPGRRAPRRPSPASPPTSTTRPAAAGPGP